MFTQDDIKNIRIIHHLVKESDFLLRCQEKLAENKEDTVNSVEIVSRLKEIKRFLIIQRIIVQKNSIT